MNEANNTTTKPETPGETENISQDDKPERLLDVLRAIVQPQETAPAPVAAPNTPATKLADSDVMKVLPNGPKTASKRAESGPSLESMGGSRPDITPSPAQSQNDMQVYAPNFAKPSTDTPVFTKGLTMNDITLPEEEKMNDGAVFDTQKAATETAQPVKEKPVPAGDDEGSSKIPSVHTLRDDMNHIVSSQSISVVKAAAMEENKRHTEKALSTEVEQAQSESQTPEKRSRAFPIILVISIGLIVVGAAALGGFFWFRSLAQAPLNLPVETTSVIFTEQTQTLRINDISTSLLSQTIDSSFRNNPALNIGSVTHIVPTITENAAIGETSSTREATLSDFLSALSIQIPNALISSLGTKLFIGAHAQDGNHLALILPVTSYERAFSAMLEWEPSMALAIAPLFPNIPNTIVNEDGSVTQNAFKDVVIKNYDTRMIADTNGRPRLFYTFPDRNTLVITSNQYTLIEILARLQAAQTRQLN